MPIKVLIVDDSALVRQMLTEILSSDPGIEVVGSASDPYVAREKIKKLNPDVLTLDVEMPRMDGVTFLRNLMRLRPMPVVMISSLTEQGADITLRALESGAVDFVSKPKIDVAHGLQEYSAEIVEKVKAAAKTRVSAIAMPKTGDAKASPIKAHFKTTDKIIAIGASTGGTEAIKEVVRHFPAGAPGVVITQHIPAAFSGPFAQRVNGITAMTCHEATHGQQVVPGHIYIAPGDKHMEIVRDGARYIIRLNDGDPVNRHKPSVDVMFDSCAKNVGGNAISVLLTGMGADGAQGMGRMKEAGAISIAQDEKTSVVWGMPGEAVKLGFADEVMPLHKIAARIMEWAQK